MIGRLHRGREPQAGPGPGDDDATASASSAPDGATDWG
jgi:hypothetical protein